MVAITGTTDVSRVEAPVTVRAYLIVAFAAFGGIFFGYDTGWMGGVLNMDYFIKQYTGHDYPDVVFPGVDHLDPQVVSYRATKFSISSRDQSLVTSILSAGTFFGAIMAGDFADFIGRRLTIILGCGIFTVGGILETASTGLGVMVAGRLIAGFGVGFISAIVILYMSEIAPKKVRGAIVAGKSIPPAESVTEAALLISIIRLPVLHYHWYLACQLCGLCYPESPGYWLVPHSNCRPILVGSHLGHWPCSPSRISSLLGEEGQAR